MSVSKSLIKKVRIGIVGAGGGGTNAVANNAHKFAPFDIDFLAINTDEQALQKTRYKKDSGKYFERKLIGKKLTSGLGAGSNPDIGWKAAEEEREWLTSWLSEKKLVFIATGMGGGTGTGSGPYVAKLAKKLGVLTVGISTIPFSFEGKERMENALSGLKTMEKYADLSIVINNNDLFKQHADNTVESTFIAADKLLGDGIITILNLILEDAYINVDFADIKKVIENAKGGFISIAFAKDVDDSGLSNNGEKFDAAISQLLDHTIVPTEMKTATRAVLSISGSTENLKMDYVRYIINSILENVNTNLDIIFGLTNNNELENNVKLSLILTGMDRIVVTENVIDLEEKYFKD